MTANTQSNLTAESLALLDSSAAEYATEFIETLLEMCVQVGASDAHIQPSERELDVRWRLDGVLQPLGRFAAGEMSSPIARLKVLAGLLTYKTDLPQEGGVRKSQQGVEMRVSTFPTIQGERAVVRFFAPVKQRLHLEDLAFAGDTLQRCQRLLSETPGMLLFAGPAGSGKTTSGYACLRHIVGTSEGGRSSATLEDPVEVPIRGVVQSQINPAAGFTFAAGLRSLLRQDPEVIYIGEIRDPETADITIQAALTGQLVISTFHAGSAAGAVGRLMYPHNSQHCI